ncbi:MAG: hypothetical protein Q4F41_07215, partial [Eubacteriales bacterium]|nr:hypothetical protein [Eubacteriales bacterium]
MGKRVRKGWALVLTLALVMALARGGGPVMAEDMEEATEAQIEAATEAVTESQTNAATEAVTEGQT